MEKLSSDKRRKEILEKLKESEEPLTGSDLAELMGVSRQVIVQDIALLRAEGKEIFATPQGYFLAKSRMPSKISRVYAVKHNFDRLEEELLLMVDLGGKVVDVIVEHPVYGEIKGNLMLSCRKDVYDFVQKLKSSQAKPLSSLTSGVHLHTVEAEKNEILEGIYEALKEKGLLLEEK